MSTAVMDRPTEEHYAAVFAEVRKRMQEQGMKVGDLAAAVGMSRPTLDNDLRKWSPATEGRYEGISKAIGWKPNTLRRYMDGTLPLPGAQPELTFSDADKPVTDMPVAAPKPKRKRKAAALQVPKESAKASVEPTKPKSDAWTPPDVPEMPAGATGGPNAQAIAALQIRQEAVEAQLIRVSQVLHQCQCSQSQ